ncbi:MAG: SUMF1/EgtB/PvdO family nonheme iron enzyme, partial [Nodosilinea sp.]
FWFFFAGHGKREGGRDYLLPADVNPRSLARTAISVYHVTERLRRCGADNIILILDACRNEGDRDGQGIGDETARIVREKGMVTLFSCSPNERSYEIDELQQGAFTHALLRGLRIQGEGNCATVERLCEHLKRQVPEISARYHKPHQTPYSIVEPLAKQHLILLPRFATTADAYALKMDAFEAEAERNWDLAEQLWTRVLAVSPADSQAIKAIKRIARQDLSPAAPPVVPPPPPPEPTGRRDAVPETLPQPTSPPEPGGRRDAVPEMPTKPEPSSPIKTFEFEVVTITGIEKGFLGRPKVNLSLRRGQSEYRVENLARGVTLEMVAIPGGQFQMGSPETEAERDGSEGPQHLVTVPGFWMSKYPVTQVQWKAVAAWPKVKQDLNSEPSRFKGNNSPVEQVSWHDAVEFCARLSQKTGQEYRLPTEAEWEYACRAGTTTPFYFGETITSDLVNFCSSYTYGSAPTGRYREQTTNAGSFPANAFGLYDMHGNVWEWCLDQWHSNYEGAPIDGSAWLDANANENARRVLRGGSWGSLPKNCRSAVRDDNNADGRSYYYGFRVVCLASRTS